MIDIVADSNTILYFFIPGKYTVQAKAVFKKDCQWIAPPLWRLALLPWGLNLNFFSGG